MDYGARAVRLRRRGRAAEVRRVRGRLPATRGPVILRPRQTRPGLPERLLRAPRGPLGSPGLPCGARVTAICVPGPLSLVRRWGLRRRGAPSATQGGQRVHAITGALPLAVGRGLLDLGPPSTQAYLPGAGPCHVGCWYHTPRRKQVTRVWWHGRRRAGISNLAIFFLSPPPRSRVRNRRHPGARSHACVREGKARPRLDPGRTQ
jgi:hypothetical protein